MESRRGGPLAHRRGGAPLRRLDDRVIPVLQKGLRAVGRGLASPLGAVRRAEERLAGGAVYAALWPRRQLLLLAIAVVAFVGAFVHLQWYPELRAEEPVAPVAGGEDRGEVPGGVPDDAPGSAVVGPVIGEEIDAYRAEREAELAAADPDETRLAVVSFGRYVRPADVEALLDGDVRVHRAQLRVPAADEPPLEVEVEGELAVAVDAVVSEERDRIAAEEQEFRRLLDSGTVNDPEFRDLYEREVERLGNTRNLLDSGAPVVFAVVVDAPVAALVALAAADDVRLVDLAPAGVEVDALRAYGLLPDDAATASHGRLR